MNPPVWAIRLRNRLQVRWFRFVLRIPKGLRSRLFSERYIKTAIIRRHAGG